jgi:hypothetical protein
MALSPDGRRLVFSAVGAHGKDQLWIRSLSALTAQPLAGTEGAMLPFWSPDSRYVGFFAGRRLKRIEASGGAAIAICDAPIPLGGAWNRDGVIVFAPDAGTGPLRQIAASGGISTPVTRLDPGRKENLHSWPSFLPDGRHFLYVATGGAEPAVRVASLGAKGNDSRLVLKDAYNAVYSQGYLLFLRETSLMAQPFDPASLATTGDAVALAEESRESTGISDVFSVSQNGLLVYRIGARGGGVQLAWFNREGKHRGSLSAQRMSVNLYGRRMEARSFSIRIGPATSNCFRNP